MRVLITITFCLITLIAAVVAAIYFVTIELPTIGGTRIYESSKSVAREVSAELAAVFQIRPRVVVSGRTVFDQEVERLSLVTRERSLTERHLLEHSWMQSTKRLEIEGDFVVRAGFDLSKPFVVEIEGDVVSVQLPEPEIFSVELLDLRILRDEDGLWNRLTAQDRENAIRELRDRVRMSVTRDSLLERVRDETAKQVAEQLGKPVDVTFSAKSEPLR